MVRINEEQIDEIKYPKSQKNDNLIYNLNHHSNPNKWHIHNSSNVYEDEEINIEDLNFTVII